MGVLKVKVGGVWEPLGLSGTDPHAPTHDVGGSDPLTNVARLNQANTFTQVQRLEGTNARIFLYDPNPPVDQRLWDIVVIPPYLALRALNDANTVAYGGLTIDRSGSLYEKQRTVPMGHWQNANADSTWFNVGSETGGNFSANIHTYQYAMIGNTMMVSIKLDNSTTYIASNQWCILLPAGKSGTGIAHMGTTFYSATGVAWEVGFCYNAGGRSIVVHRPGLINFPAASGISFYLQLTLSVQ